MSKEAPAREPILVSRARLVSPGDVPLRASNHSVTSLQTNADEGITVYYMPWIRAFRYEYRDPRNKEAKPRHRLFGEHRIDWWEMAE